MLTVLHERKAATKCAEPHCRQDGEVQCGDGKKRCVGCYAVNLEDATHRALHLLDSRLTRQNQNVPSMIAVSRREAEPVRDELRAALAVTQ